MTRAKRVDSNQKELVAVFRQLGVTVIDLSKVGKGIPDLMLGYNNKTVLVEIKSSKSAKLNPLQECFFREWKGGMLARIDNLDSAVRLVNIMRNDN